MNMTRMKKCRHISGWVSLNTGSLTGEKQVEIYMSDRKDDDTSYPYLYKTTSVTEQNKNDLQPVMFPNFKITFDELFDIE